MKTALLFLLLFLSLVSYSLLTLVFGIQQHYPVVHFIGALVALFFLGKQLREKFGILRLGANVVGWLLLGLFMWWTLIYSEYEPPPELKADSFAAQLASLSMLNEDGEAWNPADALATNEGTLLVFYRGHW